MADDPAVEPVVEPVAEPVAEPVVAATEPEPVAAEPEPAPAPAPKPPHMVPVTVVAELRASNRDFKARLEAAERKAADAEALAARLSKGEKVEAAPHSPAPPAEDAVTQRAERLLFERDVASVRDAGMAQFGAQVFTDTIRALGAYGADDDAFVSQAIAVARGNGIPAHVLLHDLAQNGEKTVGLVSMTPTQRIAELTKMALAKVEPKVEPKVETPPVKPAAKVVSSAPAPKPALAPVSAAAEVDPRTSEGNEKMTDAEFSDWWKSKGEKQFFERRRAG